MKVQQINNNQPSFGVKLSGRSLQILSKEVEGMPNGTQNFETIMKKLDRIGNRNSVIDFGPIVKDSRTEYDYGSEALDYMDAGSYIVNFGRMAMELTNSLFPKASKVVEVILGENTNLYKYLCDNLVHANEFTLNKFEAGIEAQEVGLFENFINSFKKANPENLAVEETKSMLDIIKCGFKKEQAVKMADIARKEDQTYYNKNSEIINAELEQLQNKKKELEDYNNKADAVNAAIKNILDSDYQSEKQAIINRYV